MAAPDLASTIRALLNYGAPPAEVSLALVNAINQSLPINFTRVVVGPPLSTNDNALTVEAFGFDATSPGQGRAQMLFGQPNKYTQEVVGSATTGQSYGTLITAGSNTSDFALNIQQKGPGNSLLALRGDGCLEMNGGNVVYSGNTVVGSTFQAAIQLARSFVAGGNSTAYFASNAFWNGSNYAYNTTASTSACLYAQNNDSNIGHQFYGSAAGTGGNTITFYENFRVSVNQVAAGVISGFGVVANSLMDMGPDGTTVTGTLTGCTTAPTGNVVFRKIGPLVLCQVPNIAGTSSSTGLGISVAIPSSFRPAGTRLCPVSAGAVLDGGAAVSDVAVQVTSAGTTLTFTRAGNTAGFTNTATSKGINQIFITSWIAGQ